MSVSARWGDGALSQQRMCYEKQIDVLAHQTACRPASDAHFARCAPCRAGRRYFFVLGRERKAWAVVASEGAVCLTRTLTRLACTTL